MQISEDEILKIYAEKCGDCSKKLFFHTNTNGLAFHVDIT